MADERKMNKNYIRYLCGGGCLLLLLAFLGCIKAPEAANQTEETGKNSAKVLAAEKQKETEVSKPTEAPQPAEPLKPTEPQDSTETESPKPAETEAPKETEFPKPVEMEEETLGNPRSSFGLGSAAYLKGKNILVSIFVDTPDSSWEEAQKEAVLKKISVAAAYIEEQAGLYQADTALLYDWTQHKDLKKSAQTDFSIREDVDFIDRLDEEISLWFDTKIDYEALLKKYRAQGIATLVFVNNPGISYAIVYDGTDNIKESIILFSGDYFNPGQLETATVYAHEILHVFGAHDLYEEAEFTGEVSDYVGRVYPNEIMYSVTGGGKGAYNSTINHILSPITAYHLGWIDEAEEITMFPQLNRN